MKRRGVIISIVNNRPTWQWEDSMGKIDHKDCRSILCRELMEDGGLKLPKSGSKKVKARFILENIR